MQALIRELPATISQTPYLLFKMMPAALSSVPFHENTKSVTRYFAEGFPLHLAVHEIAPLLTPPVEYTKAHVHEDYDELNIIISQQNLLYKIRLGDDEYTVNNNACIWIPRGMIHSANVLKGTGFFIAMRLD